MCYTRATPPSPSSPIIWRHRIIHLLSSESLSKHVFKTYCKKKLELVHIIIILFYTMYIIIFKVYKNHSDIIIYEDK